MLIAPPTSYYISILQNGFTNQLLLVAKKCASSDRLSMGNSARMEDFILQWLVVSIMILCSTTNH
jgi:hypothetical protein